MVKLLAPATGAPVVVALALLVLLDPPRPDGGVAVDDGGVPGMLVVGMLVDGMVVEGMLVDGMLVEGIVVEGIVVDGVVADGMLDVGGGVVVWAIAAPPAMRPNMIVAEKRLVIRNLLTMFDAGRNAS